MKKESGETRKELWLEKANRPKIAEILKALGHPLRLEIVEILSRGESCVGAIQKMTGASQSSVSQQMTILRNAGLVTVRPEGTHRFYSLANERLVELLRCLSACQAHCS